MKRRLPHVLRVRDYTLSIGSSVSYGFGREMVFVAVGWQVYDISGNPLYLGLVGLAEFLPLLLFALPAGALADRVPRKLIYMGSLAVDAVITMLLLVVSINGAEPALAVPRPLLRQRLLGRGRQPGDPLDDADARPVRAAAERDRAPLDRLPGRRRRRAGHRRAALRARARGRLRHRAVLMLISVAFVVPMKLRAIEDPPFEVGGSRLESLLAGLRFVRRTPVLLGAISLDLVAVLFGGAVALLPVFARDVLDVGPVGLGLLRSAPAVGALLAGIMLTRRPLRGMAGRKLLIVVAVFGASMVVFGLSHSFPLSFAALAVSGFADMISMNIRSMITALATPDALRGRVNAVEMVFISASNELGAFESGVAAALIGAVPAVVIGGSLTILCALAWPRLFPKMARIDRLESLHPVAP